VEHTKILQPLKPLSTARTLSDNTIKKSEHQENYTDFSEVFRDLNKREKTDKSQKGLKCKKVTATFLCWVDILKKALFGYF
jgi:hypothetical protein